MEFPEAPLNDSAPVATDLPPDSASTDVSLEETLVGLMEKGEAPEAKGKEVETPKDGQKDAAKPETPVTNDPAKTSPVFDLNGKLVLKEGQALTKQHIRELERGFLREKDYTKKTQELAKERQDIAQAKTETQNVQAALTQINQDPRNLRAYIKDQHILAAFNPHELLNASLARVGVPVQLWNEFLQFHQENGGNFAAQADKLKADPYQERFTQYENRIRSLEGTIQAGQAQTQAEKTQAQIERDFSEVGRQVDEAVTKYQVEREDLLVKMAANKNPDLTVDQLAQEIFKKAQAREQKWLETKKKHQTQRVTSPNGTSVPIVPRRPKTFDEANGMIEEAFNIHMS